MSRKRYPLRVARTAHGIRAQDLRTLVRTVWWARRWIGALESMRLGPRLGRARQYAIAGQVTALEIDGPHVEASVTGSRPDPYHVTLDFSAAPANGVAARTLASEPMLLARLLTDDLPTEVEELLRQDGVALFPRTEPLGKDAQGRPIWDVKMNCTCPDWARPCKHLVAVLLLLGEEIARHPSTLLALRGVEVEDLAPSDGPAAEAPVASVAGVDDGVTAAATEPAPLVKRLGAIPYWRGSQRCQEALSKIYARVRPVALEALEAHSVDLRK